MCCYTFILNEINPKIAREYRMLYAIYFIDFHIFND